MNVCRIRFTALMFAVAIATLFDSGHIWAANDPVPLYRTFETAVQNDKDYANKFTDVELKVVYTKPSTLKVEFMGFYDGDGIGGGDATKGNVWKMRFIPDEVGTWNYSWSWSDGSPGGDGTFQCVEEGAGKGILQAYTENPYWLAYNGTDPVWIKSYYETGHGGIAQDFGWISDNVYQPLLDRGYNHVQVNWLLSLCCFAQYYLDGPPPSSEDLELYTEGEPTTTMRLDVWQMMENRMSWLNDRDMGVHMFLGFEGRKNGGPSWDAMTAEEKDFFVKYVVARIAPYANLAGWNFVWEDPGDRLSHELGCARLIEQYDIFNHLRTYQDEHPRDNEYHRPEYNFAAIENHYIMTQGHSREERDIDIAYWGTPWSHHIACLVGYVPGKPVFMSEGNVLWRRFWHERVGADQDDLRQGAWACATAASSFTWNGHEKEYELYVRGPIGMPFHGDDNPYVKSAKYMDIMADVMNKEVTFYTMTPADYALTYTDPLRVWAMAEDGKQYLVFSSFGEKFTLNLRAGNYTHNMWLDTKTGEKKPVDSVKVAQDEVTTERGKVLPDNRRVGTKAVEFTPPSTDTDWVLLVRAE